MNNSLLLEIKEEITSLVNESISKLCLDNSNMDIDTVKTYLINKLTDINMSKYIKENLVTKKKPKETVKKPKKIPEENERCVSLTKSGDQCKRKKTGITEYCSFHYKSNSQEKVESLTEPLLKLNITDQSEHLVEPLVEKKLNNKKTPKNTLTNEELEELLKQE